MVSNLKVVNAKLHCIRVTGAELNYHGSVTIDQDICEAAGILPMEFVEIWNKNSGARISTYVIYGPKQSRDCILNGAAARTCQKNDELIIVSSRYCEPSDIYKLAPKILIFNENNQILEKLVYKVEFDELNNANSFLVEKIE